MTRRRAGGSLGGSPEPVVLTDEQRAEWRESLRQSRADLGAWLAAGCPGLTPEIERALTPGTLDRLWRFADASEAGERPDPPAPPVATEGGRPG